MTLRYTTENSWVGLLGLGLKYFASPRWGIRADVRGHLSRNRTHSLLDASPAVAELTPYGGLALSSRRAASLQFVNDGGRWGDRSTLSGSPITGFETFTGTGMQTHLNAAVGLFLRF